MSAPDPSQHPAQLDEAALLAQCEVQRTRRSGPGGQHRNKVESAIVLTHLPTGVISEASERRSQHENRQVAIRRLRVLLAVCVRQTPSVATTPSELWQSRCARGRIVCSVEHDDFPALLAEALDALAYAGWEPREASERLGCTSSQLVRFVKLEPAAFTELNRQRSELGLHPLH
ncbi:MAG TPA: peptide chain release factor-like protein [Planctomycetaceae bacterium]|nr:peptide chain release factor-like protein [Planctomycetaceae bacterium]